MNSDNFMVLFATPSSGAGAASGGSSVVSLVTFGLLFLVMYMLLIRPQSRRKKQHRQQLEMLALGDKVATIGGIHGTVTHVDQTHIIVKVDDNTKIKFSKEAIATVFPKASSSQKQQEMQKSKPTSSSRSQETDAQQGNLSEKKASGTAQETKNTSK